MASKSADWKDWIPGVLSEQQVQWLCENRTIRNAAVDNHAIGSSAIDLHLSEDCYLMKAGSVKPLQGEKYHDALKTYGQRMKKSQEYRLNAGKTYVFPLHERLIPRDIQDRNIFGQATAKSSVGRVDVLARLIADGSYHYEGFQPESLTTGDLYVEVTPMTFNVIVKAGISLSQLRLFIGNPDNCALKGSEISKCVLGHGNTDASLSLDLTNAEIAGLPASAFFVKRGKENQEPVRLWKTDQKPEPWKYWRLQASNRKRFTIEAGNFYILRSKERIRLPPGVAVYCRASDETLGEMRIHYAGFVHPHFGYGTAAGTPLIFEVRGHDFPVNLKDGEKMAQLIFYRMSRDSERSDRSYEGQNLQLSKFFGNWPKRLEKGEGGQVAPAN